MASAGSRAGTRKSCQINQSQASAARAIFLLIMLISSRKTKAGKTKCFGGNGEESQRIRGENLWF